VHLLIVLATWIGNEADPITPLISAERVAGALGDSAVLIKHMGYGVCFFGSQGEIELLTIT
jgi:hypothetical protein